MNNSSMRPDLLPSRRRPTRAGDVVRRIGCGCFAVAGVALIAFAWPADKHSKHAARAKLTTAVFSARRAPQVVSESVAAPQLTARLTDALSGVDATCARVDAPGIGTVADIRSTQPLTGASTQKVLTARAALTVRGPTATYSTNVLADSPDKAGKVAQATLVGSGDPMLDTAAYRAYLLTLPAQRGRSSTSLESLADAIAGRGIRAIDVLAVDDSRYDTVRFLPTWRPSYATDGHVGALGALIVNDGFASWERGRTPAADPALNAGEVLAALLRERSVQVGTIRRASAAPGTAILASVNSAPMVTILGSVLKSSNNTAAELIARELAVMRGMPGTTENGMRIIAETLQQLNVPMAGVSLLDGSGLSRDNTVTCTTLLAALQAGSGPTDLFDLLAVAAQSGTLATRFVGSPLAGKLHAKTGTLNGVTGLTGYIDVYDRVPFSFLANSNFSEESAMALQARVANAIRTYPGEVSLVVPIPSAPCTPGACR